MDHLLLLPKWQFWTIAGAALLWGYAVGRVVEYGVKRMRKIGKAWHFSFDPESGLLVRRLLPIAHNGDLVLRENKRRGIPGKRFITRADARMFHEGLPAWIQHAKYGYSYKAPATRDTLSKDNNEFFSAWGPEDYYDAVEHNDAMDTLDASRGEPSSLEKLAPWAMIGLVMILGGVMALVWMVLKLMQGMAKTGAG